MGNVVFATSTLCSNPYINTCTIFYHSLEAHKKFIEENLLKDNNQLPEYCKDTLVTTSKYNGGNIMQQYFKVGSLNNAKLCWLQH